MTMPWKKKLHIPNCLFQILYPTIHVMASVLAWASSVVNPFIYAGSNRQYRAAYRKLLCCVGSPGHGDTDYQTGAPAEGGGLTHSHSGSGKTFITDMFQYNAATDNVHTVRVNGNEWNNRTIFTVNGVIVWLVTKSMPIWFLWRIIPSNLQWHIKWLNSSSSTTFSSHTLRPDNAHKLNHPV